MYYILGVIASVDKPLTTTCNSLSLTSTEYRIPTPSIFHCFLSSLKLNHWQQASRLYKNGELWIIVIPFNRSTQYTLTSLRSCLVKDTKATCSASDWISTFDNILSPTITTSIFHTTDNGKARWCSGRDGRSSRSSHDGRPRRPLAVRELCYSR